MDGNPICVTSAERSKYNIGLCDLFIGIVILGQTHLISIMTVASTVVKNQLFKNISHLNALGSKVYLDVK